MQRLRVVSYLSPSIPAELYELIARDLGEQCGVAVVLSFEESISGPLDGDDDLFARGAADVGFLCAPSYRWLNARRRAVELLPLPVPSDPRAEGRPVYFADVVVRADSPARTFADLAGARWSFNDRNSKSGWFSMLERIAPHAPAEFFGRIIASGSHLRSLELVAGGGADAAAIDSNVLRANARDTLRVLESWDRSRSSRPSFVPATPRGSASPARS
jgi:ABC-type phosphate/phosphonate transport system substrate-binding protein